MIPKFNGKETLFFTKEAKQEPSLTFLSKVSASETTALLTNNEAYQRQIKSLMTLTHNQCYKTFLFVTNDAKQEPSITFLSKIIVKNTFGCAISFIFSSNVIDKT